MQARSRAAATALLLTAAAGGLAATGGSAQAIGSHHGGGAARAATLTVTLKSTTKGPKASTDTIRPGKTLFKVTRGNAGGRLQVLRLKSGYTIKQLGQDIGPLMQGDVPTVKRVDKNVVFYGGIAVPAKGDPANKFGTDIDKAGTYYVVNLGKVGGLTTFRAKGASQRRTLPTTTGRLGMKDSASFAGRSSDPHRGWMKTTNNATQPHFVDLSQVKKSTTNQDVQDWIANPQGPPPFAKAGGGHAGIEVVSPGHTVIWKYGTHAGRYVAFCFYPDKKTGMPHAFMGMYKLVDLT